MDLEHREEQIEGEIHQVQGELSETLEALGEKVNPKQVVETAKAKAHQKIDHVADRVSPPRIVRRQVEKVKDRIGGSDDARASQVGRKTRKRIAEAAREVEAR